MPNFDEQKFLNDRYNDYLIIQKAWSDFDYDTLRNKLTDELYNQYLMQLDTLKLKNQKNIISDFDYELLRILDANNENGQVTVKIKLVCNFYDYIEQNGVIIRGKNDIKAKVYYELTFVCNMENDLAKCPNCGAELNNNASKVCEYCRSLITVVSSNWVMSKKEVKNQW